MEKVWWFYNVLIFEKESWNKEKDYKITFLQFSFKIQQNLNSLSSASGLHLIVHN